MSDSHTVPAQSTAHAHGPSFQSYMMIFYILCVFTLVSFLVNWLLGHNTTSAGIILGVAAIKATLVGVIFMNLKYDWGKLFGIIIPVSILGIMMIIILSIDQAVVWHFLPME